MTLSPRANEVPELIRRLGSRRQAAVDAARARLAIVGARAVEALIDAIEGDNARMRAHAMPLLALIQDPRGREPLIAMLLDTDAKMREIAARCLARFPGRESLAGLERLLRAESRIEVKVAAVEALVEQAVSGHEPALRPTLHILLDPAEDVRLRQSALALLPALKPAARRELLKRLRQDGNPEMAARASELSEAVPQEDRAGLRQLLADLAATEYATWNDAVRRLAARGAPTLEPLVEEMRRRSHDPEYCTRAGMVLRALGPQRARAVSEALETVEEPLALQVLVEVIGAFGQHRMIHGLKSLIDRIAASPSPDGNGMDPMQRVRAKAHLELARIGSRVAVEDLRQALRDRDRRIEIEMVAAVEKIGNLEEVFDLLRAYRYEDRFMKERIADVIRVIFKRERIRRTHPNFSALSPESRRVLDSVLTPAAMRKAARRPRARK
ncbi:MAG TPA: HEAT repeat domain-containing protein [Candidatus Polarisedimenticolaceae bacterium]|nr:HEAT repeat domain-containing protein [Candidatus Polarisedimenticolaceae bacterium]